MMFMTQLWEQFEVHYFAREHKDCKIYGSKHQPLSHYYNTTTSKA